MTAETYVVLVGLVVALVSLLVAVITGLYTWRAFQIEQHRQQQAELDIDSGEITKTEARPVPQRDEPDKVWMKFRIKVTVINPSTRANSLLKTVIKYNIGAQPHCSPSTESPDTPYIPSYTPHVPCNIEAGFAKNMEWDVVLGPARLQEEWQNVPPSNVRLVLTPLRGKPVTKCLPEVPRLIRELPQSSAEIVQF